MLHNDWIYFLGIFSSSLLGSFHCLGMCGALAATQTSSSLKGLYHLFRLLGYLCLGALAGFVGDALVFSWLQKWIAPSAAIFTSIILFFLAWQLFRAPTKRFHIKFPGLHKIFHFLANKPRSLQATGIGFFTAFLPCGWLYSYVLIALAAGSWFGGSLTLFVFWLGTVPILLLGQQLVSWIPRKALATIILVMAVGSVGLKFFPGWIHGSLETCVSPTLH